MNATQQSNDYIKYKGQQSELDINWSSPSPLEAYFTGKNKADYPFEVLHTGNYRGHIATWDISNDKLYLDKVTIPKSIFHKSEATISETNEKIALNKILPKNYISKNKAFASWFTGHLLIKSTPYEKLHKSEYDDAEFYVLEFKKYSIVQINKGIVVSEKSFDSKKFWDLTSKYYGYQSIAKSDFKVISNFYDDNGARKVQSVTDEESSKVVYTEGDFDVFIERMFINRIKVPLTEYAIITDVSKDAVGAGWFSERDFKIKKGSNVLYIEMGSTNVPNGPWNDYTGGSIQILLPIENISESETFQNQNVTFINNFAKHGSPQSISVDLLINKVKKESLILKGVIKLKSESPDTIQKINFDGKNIPIYSLLEYLKKHEDDEYSQYDANEVFNKIKSKSTK